MKKVRHLKDNGFTLMELLLAMTLFSIIAVAIYSSIAVGIKAHKKGEALAGRYNDLRFAFNTIGQDMRTAVNMSGVYLVTEPQKLSFHSIQNAKGNVKEICKITYLWGKEKDYYKLYRLKEGYIDSLQGSRPKGDAILDGIKELGFSYGYQKKTTSGEKEFKWKEEWKAEYLPRLVKLRLKIRDEVFNKYIFCPAGKMGEIKEE